MDKIDLALKDFLEKGGFASSAVKASAPACRTGRDLRGSAAPNRALSAEYPSIEDLCRFIHDELDSVELERILNYLKIHPEDQELVAQARGLLSRMQEADSQSAPAVAVRRAQGLMGQTTTLKCPHCGKPITPFKQPFKRQWLWNGLWLMLAILSFSLSFFVPRYFFQCLAAALLFGIKWIVEHRAQKTKILIYKALQREEYQSLHRISSHL